MKPTNWQMGTYYDDTLLMGLQGLDLLWVEYFFKFEHKHTYITSHLTSQHYVVYHPLQIVILVSLVLLEIITAA